MNLHRAIAATAFCALVAATPPVAAQPAAADPLDSARWTDMHRSLLDGAPVEFDERVRVVAPATAENPMQVPVTVDATALPGVQEVLVFADFNPIVRVLRFFPEAAPAQLGFRIKLQQSTPVRAAARTADGRWHVGGTWVNTVGGGCTAPSAAAASTEWQRRLNEVSGRQWTEGPNAGRLRLRIVHPMDTGLVAGVPALYIERLELQDAAQQPWWRMQLHEPVSENPLLTVEMPLQGPKAFRLLGQDNNGNRIDAEVRA